ncbi:MAG: hypothetical protein ABSD44_11855 [Terracidiphilus sp.]
MPDEEQGIIARLTRLADPALEGLERALCRATPTLDREKLISQLSREPVLAEVADLDEIVASLVNVASTAYSNHVETSEFVQVVVDTIKNDHVIELSDSDAQVLRDRLTRLAGSKCLELIAKGNLLLRANGRNYRKAQITTDLRPVFLGEDLNVSAGLILHQLAVHASHNGRSETVFFALDSEDLTSLSRVVSRAIEKEKSLRDLAAKSGTPIITVVSEE